MTTPACRALCAVRARYLFAALALAVLLTTGCATKEWVTVRKVPKNPLNGPLRLLSDKGPRTTPRTRQYLRQSDMPRIAAAPPREMLARLHQHVAEEPTAGGMYAIAELTYVAGVRAARDGDDALALDMYGASVAHAYMYLLDDRFAAARNEFDPEYRRACDLYNESLEGALRIVAKGEGLKPGKVLTVHAGQQEFDIEIDVVGRWKVDEIEEFLFASDYELNGLANHFHTFGLGVPLIAVRKWNGPGGALRKQGADASPLEKYYPPGLTFPMTAFLHVAAHKPPPHQTREGEVCQDEACRTVHRCVLAVYDPLETTQIAVNNGRTAVPLESDLSVPLAYFLNQPVFRKGPLDNIAYIGLLNPTAGKKIQGLYMLEPYDPNKVPVVFVHGLASSPVTWTEMYNDLRAAPEIRERCQFWFYFYPTGQPFWVSATQFRKTLADTLAELDPQRQSPQLDEMVLIGHSMGGLLSKLQTIESGNDFWRLVSDRTPEELAAGDGVKRTLISNFYFRPSPSVRRVVTIGTPHRGSDFANPLTRTLTRAVTEIPNMMLDTKWQLVRANPGYFKDSTLVKMETGVDSLVPNSPFLPLMLESPRAAWVTHHNIVGVVDNDDFLRRVAGEKGDGIVSLASAHLDYVASEITVPAGHTAIHRHAKAIREVQRILREHLRQLQADQLRLASFTDRQARLSGPRHGYRWQDHYPAHTNGARDAAPVFPASVR